VKKTDRILRRLKLRDLQMLLAVVEHGNLARAAHSLSITRPVVSKTIADLERTMGVRLLDRSPQKVEPTLFGRVLLKRGVAVFDELRQSVEEIEFLSAPHEGELRIGCSEYMAAGLIPAAIDRLSRNYPKLLFQAELDNPYARLRERKVEFVIARLLTPNVEPDMDSEILFHEKVFIAAGPGNKWLGRRKIRLADLVDEPWMLAPLEIAPDSPIAQAFKAQGLAVPQARVLGYSLPLRNGLLATGRFLTMVPGSVLRFGAESQLLKVLSVELPSWRFPVAIVTLKNRTLSPVAELFLACVREVARPLARAA
jgi:DNA-binding transcriptional LysR family regulator